MKSLCWNTTFTVTAQAITAMGGDDAVSTLEAFQ